METSIWQSIALTPWWVYFIGTYLIWAGYQATKPRLVTVSQLTIMPVLFLSLSVMNMCAMPIQFSVMHLSIWGSTLFLGVGLSYLQCRLFKIKTDKASNSLCLPGTWLILIALMVCVALKFYFDISLSIDPMVFINPENTILSVFLYGLITGLFIGRLSYTIRCLRVGDFT
jgi:hypothetical protein